MSLFDLEWKTTINEEDIKRMNEAINRLFILKKPNNSAPKSIKGDYDLSIHGNKIVLVDNIEGTSVEAKCSPEDNFDIGEGIKEAFKKMNAKREEIRKEEEEEKKRIKVGDWVQVINNGRSYTTYPGWLYDRVGFQHVKKYVYGDVPPNGLIGRVIVTGNHETNKSKKLIGLEADDCVYIINIEGVKKVKAPQ